MVSIMASFLSSALSEMLISEFFISAGCCRGYLRFLELSQAVMAFLVNGFIKNFAEIVTN